MSSARLKASIIVFMAHILRSLSLFITSRESTLRDSSSTPSRAWSIRFSRSKRKGIVTTPTVSTPAFLASLAITGAAPVPVPPPIPAVMKTMRVPSSNILLISSRLSSAISRPFAGLLPAPSPSSPNCRRTGTGESMSAMRSVLQTSKRTSRIPSLYMCATALPPPPPTPITFIIRASEAEIGSSTFGISNSIIINLPVYLQHALYI